MKDRCIDCYYLEQLGQPDDIYRDRFVCTFHHHKDGTYISVDYPREQSCGTDFLSESAGHRNTKLEKLLNE